MNNAVERYNLTARALHWSMALLILAVFFVGLYMHELPKDDPVRPVLYGMHKSTGVVIFLLLIVRFIWRLTHTPPALPSELSARDKSLAHAGHMMLYLLMFFTPVAGYVISVSGGHAINVYGLFELPMLIGQNKELHEVAEEGHEILAFSMIFLVIIHVAGALKHQIMEHIPIINRMK